MQDCSLQGTMSTFPSNSGLPSVLTGDNASQQSGSVWRPWAGKEGKSGAHTAHSSDGDLAVAKHPKTPHFIHPVKLFWPKSRCFDYLYQDAEKLLRSYPVQAAICLYEDSSSDEGSDEEEEVGEEEGEEMEKDLN